MDNRDHFPYRLGKASVALKDPDFFYWDSSVIFAEGRYHLFVSRWGKSYGFGWNWLFRSEIVHCVSATPEGPFHFQNVILAPRGREFFDGMSTHNPCIAFYQGRYYLYYMGTTFGGEVPSSGNVPEAYALETWNRKRIGLAVSSSIDAPFIRQERPLLEPRDCSHWDDTITTNPTVAVLPDGRTYLIYKSRRAVNYPLQLGIAFAPNPAGPFTRLNEGPLLDGMDVEDPFLFYDSKRHKFCLLAKDNHPNEKNPDLWGSGIYAESDDAIHFSLVKNPLVYTRHLLWEDGHESTQTNLERASLLLDAQGNPLRLYFATGEGKTPYFFDGTSYVVSLPLKPE
jgi:hypothetical protein